MSGPPATRSRGVAVAAVALGAGLVLLGASRVWLHETVPQPAPLSPRAVARTGASLLPALPALGLVALAGAGGLLATRGLARRAVAVLVAASGATAAGLALIRVGDSPGWVVLTALGGLLAAGAGIFAVLRSGAWPGMGRRYERGERPRDADPEASQDLWAAIDRGEDPTRR